MPDHEWVIRSHPTRRPAVLLVLLLVLTGCSSTRHAVSSKISSGVSTYRDPWAASCATVDVALRLDHHRRASEIDTLNLIARTPNLPDQLAPWLHMATRVLTWADPTTLDSRTKNDLNGPCQQHHRSIGALS